MQEIIPAIMPENFIDMRHKMGQILGAVPIVQLDIMDGKFVRSRTFPYNSGDEADMAKLESEDGGMPYWQDVDVELDLMVRYAHKSFDMFMAFAPKRIIYHIEAEATNEHEMEEFKEYLEAIDMYTRENVEFGIAIGNDTPLENIYPLIPYVSFVQCMGIANIGYQGEPFDERVIGRVQTLKIKFPDLDISVDGSVNEDTIHHLQDAGVDRFVIGSAIFADSDPRGKIKEFKDML
jgi:ribulose-phosphate 3-epimerase